MEYEDFWKYVKYNPRTIWIPILQLEVLRSSFIKDGKYEQKLVDKLLKAVYDKRKFRKEREAREYSLFESSTRFKE